MTGQELYNKYVSLRDFSGSPSDDYAQLLQTIFFSIGEDIFPLLEKAEKQSKRLWLIDSPFVDYTSLSDVILV